MTEFYVYIDAQTLFIMILRIKMHVIIFLFNPIMNLISYIIIRLFTYKTDLD